MDPNVKLIHETALRWSTAVANADIAALGELMTDDIVVIHGNGRMLQGKEAVTADLVRGLADVRIVQSVRSEETVVTGEWAFDRASVQTVITPRSGNESKQWDSRTVTILRRDHSGQWRVARAIGVSSNRSQSDWLARRTGLKADNESAVS